jgi:hypothetical protein
MTSSRKSEAIFQKGLILFFFAIAVAAFVYQLYLDNYYHLNGAREPVPTEGRIYREFVHHGSQVFLTKREQFDLDVLFPSIAIGSFLIGGLFALRWKLFGADKQKPFWPFVRRRPYDLD